MKLKGLFGSLLVLGLSLSFSFADNTWYNRDIDVLGYSPSDNNLNIAISSKGQLTTTSQGSIQKDMLYFQDNNDYKTAFFRTQQGLPYFYIYLRSDNSAFQGVPNRYRLCNTGYNTDSTPCESYPLTYPSSEFFGQFLSTVNSSDVWSFISYGNFLRICISSNSFGKSLCFGYSSYGSDGNLALGRYSILSDSSLNIAPATTFDNFPSSVLGVSPGVSVSPIGDIHVDSSCPTVGQIKSASNLSSDICYGGFPESIVYGDSGAFVGGSGLDLFSIYNLYSGGMQLQTWYDTYYAYYKDINHYSSMFEGKSKSLLGLEFARDTFAPDLKGSYKILNYCYYVINNVSNTASSCVVNSVSTVYPGITFTDDDKADIRDGIINNNNNVQVAGSGSAFYGGGAGGGGSNSWGDECSEIGCLFSKFFDLFNSDIISRVSYTGGNGILPSYIGLAFVIVVLFYIFKR